jgi:glycosyltransferase involved in cell wall biosynthesis
MSKVDIITPSFNKPVYVKECIDSVMAQTYKDFNYWIVDNSNDGETRRIVDKIVDNYHDPRILIFHEDYLEVSRADWYIPAVILNTYYPQMKAEYQFYISDDDLLLPNCIERMVTYMELNKNVMVTYHSQKSVRIFSQGATNQDNQIMGTTEIGTREAKDIVRVGMGVDCMLDGGQIMFRKSCLDKLEPPYYPEENKEHIASHCDGTFMNKLNKLYDFYPVNEVLSIHRVTPQSKWTNSI